MACVGDSIQANYEGSADDISNMGTTAPIGQAFTVPTNCNVCAVSFYGGKGTVGTQPGTFKIEILSGSYNGTVIATTGTLNSTDFGVWTSPAWWKVGLTTNVDLVTGTTYYMKMTALTGSTNDCMRWGRDNTSPSYSGGAFWSGTGAGTENTSLDCLFRIHGTSGAITVNPTVQDVTCSIPTYTPKLSSVIAPATQVDTFSIPTYTTAQGVRVTANAQVATFTIPAYTATSGATVVQPNTQSMTFDIPAYNSRTYAIVMPDGQTLTYTLPARTINVTAFITITPTTVSLVITTVGIQRIGAVWRKSGRNSSGDWTRISRNSD